MIGARLKAERVRRSWSQRELARRAGVSPAYVNMVESGERSRLSTDMVEKLAVALGLTVSDLLAAESEAVEPDPPLIPAGPVYARLRPGSSLPPDLLDLLVRVGARFSPADWARIRGYIERLAEERVPK